MSQFASSDWSRVWPAKEALESLQREAIPGLLGLLGRDEYVKLQNTADLIYPGASTFFGHGGVVVYDIDWVSVRAGWALEDLTFQAFGFREGAIDHEALLRAAIAGNSDVPLSTLVPPPPDVETRRRRRSRAVSAATTWWAAQSSGHWTRQAAVLEALKSNEAARQATALDWLRHGKTHCDGLTEDLFTRRILPEVRRLTEAGSPEVKKQAAYLVRDFDSGEWYWLRIKRPPRQKR